MMWNLLVSGLLTEAAIVLYDGSPGHPDLDVLWDLAERVGDQLLRHQRELHLLLHEGRGRAARQPGPERAAQRRLDRLAAARPRASLGLRARRA